MSADADRAHVPLPPVAPPRPAVPPRPAFPPPPNASSVHGTSPSRRPSATAGRADDVAEAEPIQEDEPSPEMPQPTEADDRGVVPRSEPRPPAAPPVPAVPAQQSPSRRRPAPAPSPSARPVPALPEPQPAPQPPPPTGKPLTSPVRGTSRGASEGGSPGAPREASEGAPGDAPPGASPEEKPSPGAFGPPPAQYAPPRAPVPPSRPPRTPYPAQPPRTTPTPSPRTAPPARRPGDGQGDAWSAGGPPQAPGPEPEPGPGAASGRGRGALRTVAAAVCLVLGVGLLGGAAAGAWLSGGSGEKSAEEEQFDEVRDLWHTTPVNTLFPRTLRGAGAGPGGADREWLRVAVAPDSGCADAFDPLLTKALSPVGCHRLVRATYVDETTSSVTTVGMLFTRAGPDGMRRLHKRFAEENLTERTDMMPRARPARGTAAADFGDAQRASWTVRVLAEAPVVVYSVTGFADGRTVSNPQSASEATDKGETSAPAQAGLGHDTQGIADRIERGLRKKTDALEAEDGQ